MAARKSSKAEVDEDVDQSESRLKRLSLTGRKLPQRKTTALAKPSRQGPLFSNDTGVETIYMPCSCTFQVDGKKIQRLMTSGIRIDYPENERLNRLEILRRIGYVPGTYMTPLYHNLLSRLIRETYNPYQQIEIILRHPTEYTSLIDLAEAVQVKAFKSKLDKLIVDLDQVKDFKTRFQKNQITNIQNETPDLILNYLKSSQVQLESDQTEFTPEQLHTIDKLGKIIQDQMAALTAHTPKVIQDYLELGPPVGNSRTRFVPGQLEFTKLQIAALNNLERRSVSYIDSLNRGFREMIGKDLITPKQELLLGRLVQSGYKQSQRDNLTVEQRKLLERTIEQVYSNPNELQIVRNAYIENADVIQNPELHYRIILQILHDNPLLTDYYFTQLQNLGNELFIDPETIDQPPPSKELGLLIDYYLKFLKRVETPVEDSDFGLLPENMIRFEDFEKVALKQLKTPDQTIPRSLRNLNPNLPQQVVELVNYYRRDQQLPKFGPYEDEEERRYSEKPYQLMVDELVDRYDFEFGTELTPTQQITLLRMVRNLSSIQNTQIGYERVLAEGYIPGSPMSRIQIIQFLNISRQCCHATVLTPSRQPVLKHEQSLEPKEDKSDKNPLTFDIKMVDQVLQLIPSRASNITDALAIAFPKFKKGKVGSTIANERIVQNMLKNEEQILRQQGYSNEKIIKHLIRLRADLQREDAPVNQEESGQTKPKRQYKAI